MLRMEGTAGKEVGEAEEKQAMGGGDHVGGDTEAFSDSTEDECGGSSCFSSETSCSEETAQTSSAGSEESVEQPAALVWPMGDAAVSRGLAADEEKHSKNSEETDKLKYNAVSDVEMMKERFSKLLLGEDMSGCGKGVCTALAISNGITNLCGTIFGQLWRLEPLPPEKKSMWLREMDWLLCVSDHIVELIPTWQTFPDGSKVEVMTCRPRSDLHIDFPALRKLDHMLLEILDSFREPEFWYVDQGILTPDADQSIHDTLQRKEDKWWLPVPRVPPGGLSEKTRKHLQHKRESTNQILKAVMAINSNALAEMEVPESYLSSLPKNGRASLGDLIHRYITSDQFSSECLLDCLDLSSEHQALEIANRVEAAIYIWRKQTGGKSLGNKGGIPGKSSWSMVKDLIMDADKRELLADRAESLMMCLKQRFPGLTQTTLDMTKIQYNKDVGKSILESYSRVLESLAFNIVTRIDELLNVDNINKHSDQHLESRAGLVAQKKVQTLPHSVPPSGTPYATAYGTPNFSPSPLISPAKGERMALVNKSHNRGFDVRKVLTNYLSGEVKVKSSGISNEMAQRISSMKAEALEHNTLRDQM